MPSIMLETSPQVANGASASLSTEGFALGRINLNVSSVVVGVTVLIEQSHDGTTWTQAYTSGILTGTSSLDVIVPDLTGHLRVRWTLASGASATLGASADLARSYASTDDLHRYGTPSAGLGGISLSDQGEALVVASALADGFLRGKYTLPLVSWQGDLTRAVCHIAQYDLLCTRGMSPVGDSYAILLHLYESAMSWLSDVSKGRVIIGCTDSAIVQPDTVARHYCVSSPVRGW